MKPDDPSVDGAAEVGLSTVCEVAAGPSGSLLRNLGDVVGGVPVITPSDISETDIDPSHIRRVPEVDAKKLARFALHEGDILMVRQGALGRLAVVGREHVGALYGSSFLRIRPKTGHVVPEYLTACLGQPHVREQLLGSILPGKIPQFNPDTLRQIRIPLPELERQKLIVETLAEMDEVIQRYRAAAGRLESLKPSVFSHMLSRKEGNSG